MAKHAFAAYVMSFHRRRRTSERQTLGNLNGSDLLHLMHGLLKDIEALHVKSEKPPRVLIVSEILPRGRMIQFKTRYGTHGLDGEIVHVDTAEVTHSYTEDESAVSPTRNMVVVPPHGQHAVLLTERYGGDGAYSMIKKVVTDAVRNHFNDEFTVLVEALHDDPSWQAYVDRADMTSIEVNRYRLSSDGADESLVSTIGRITTEFKPHRGHRLPGPIKTRLIAGQVKVDDLVGIDFGDDSEVVVNLDDGTQKKKLVVGQNENAALIYPVADDEDARPADNVIYAKMRSQVGEFNRLVTESLPTGWESGEWDQSARDVTMRAYRDQ